MTKDELIALLLEAADEIARLGSEENIVHERLLVACQVLNAERLMEELAQ